MLLAQILFIRQTSMREFMEHELVIVLVFHVPFVRVQGVPVFGQGH